MNPALIFGIFGFVPFIYKMGNYKLYYFNVTGLAEPIRYLLHYCGIEFDDIRFSDFEEWNVKYKKEMPMEQVPVLEIDGVKFHQHTSICRYIANKFNLCGANGEESLEIDAIVNDINDMRIEIANYYKEEDLNFKTKLEQKLLEKLPFFLNKFESRVLENNGFFFKNEISWADIYYAGITEVMSNILKRDINEKYSNLKKLTDNIRRNEKIKAYLDKRPTTVL